MKNEASIAAIAEIDGEAKKSFLDILNEKHAVVVTKGDTSIVRWEENPLHPGVMEPAFMSERDFNLLYRNRKVKVRHEVKKKNGASHDPKQFKDVKEQATKIWLESPQRATYEGLGMYPGHPDKIVNGRLNLWTGFGVEAAPGDWSLMQQHILEVLADGNEEYASYITKWAAWKIQNPGEPPEVALCFQGRKGTGKGVFARSIKTLFGSHGKQVSDRKHVTSNFNAHLITCALLYSDEAMWPKNSEGDDGNIKRLITEPSLFIEPKGIDRFEVKNHVGLIMTGNAEWQVLATDDERRYASFEVSECHRGDRNYFKKLYAQIEHGGEAAMLHDLQNMGLGDWHPRDDVPRTKSLHRQIQLSLNPLESWLNDLIFAGRLPGDMKGKGRVLFSDLKAHAHARRDLQGVTDMALSLFVKQFAERRLMGKSRLSGFAFPPLYEVREEWSRKYPDSEYENDSEGAEWLPDEPSVMEVPDEEDDFPAGEEL